MITVIVLLILAGVTIATLTGDNGLLQKTTTAKQENENAKELELIKLAVGSAKIAGEGAIKEIVLNEELITNLGGTETAKHIGNNWYYKGYIIKENGIVEKYDKLLPEEFQQVKYIEGSGTQYINTGYYPDLKTNAKYKASVSNYKQYGPHLLSSKYYAFPFYRNENKSLVAFRGNEQLKVNNTEFNIGTIYEFEAFKNNQVIVNGQKLGELESIAEKDSVPLYIGTYGGSPGDANYTSNTKFYYCIIYDNDMEVRNFIPCYSTTTVTDVEGIERSKDIVGLYDIVNGQFYVNKGTGSFGYELENGTYVAPK